MTRTLPLYSLLSVLSLLAAAKPFRTSEPEDWLQVETTIAGEVGDGYHPTVAPSTNTGESSCRVPVLWNFVRRTRVAPPHCCVEHGGRGSPRECSSRFWAVAT